MQSRTNRNHHHGREAVQLEENLSEIPPRRTATATPNPDQEGLQQPQPGWTFSEPAQRQESLLTAREIEVLQAIVNGACNAEIAESLKITPETVKTHVKNILRKLKARDRTQAVVIALRASPLSLPD
jgi:DNA-binding NarL/FixJ family response regulator